MASTMELVPVIRSLGPRYVIVDSRHVEPADPMRRDEVRYRPHVTRHAGAEIVVVVRDRELSDAQESGMEPGWFIREVQARTRHCDFTPLVVTCTERDNGGWFRNTTRAPASGPLSHRATGPVPCTRQRRYPPGLHPRTPRRSPASRGLRQLTDFADADYQRFWSTKDPDAATRAQS
jgi:hypothetical protein